MQIDSIELFHVALPLRQPQTTPAGPRDALETVLVRMRSGDVAGWGDASPGNAPTAGGEWAAGVFGCLRDWMAPMVAGTEVESGEKLTERLKDFRGNRYAKAALDTAWWDLRARLEDKPLHALLDGKRDEIELGVTFDQMDSVEDFLAEIGRAFETGFARVRLMFRPGWDVQMVDTVRKEFATERLHVDVEGALGLEHMELLYRLDDFGIEMVEQPFSPADLVGHAMLQESSRTPVCLDEGVTTPAQAEMALDLHSCRYMNVNPGRVGGLTPAVAIDDACLPAEVPCFLGAAPQSAVGVRIGLALAARENFTYPADYIPPEETFVQHLAPPLVPRRSGESDTLQVKLWSESGIGIEPDMELLEKACIARAEV